MLDKTTKMLLVFMFAMLLQAGSAIVALADVNRFGSSCGMVNIPGDPQYLTKTAYDYVLRNISMPCTTMVACPSGQASTPASPCCAPGASCQDTGSTNLTLCIRTTAVSSDMTCTNKTLTVGSSIPIKLDHFYSSFISGPPDTTTGAEVVNVTVELIGAQLCLTMPTPYGKTPLMCKSAPGSGGDNTRDVPPCTPLTPACYGNSQHSQSPFNFSGQAFECLTGSLDNIFFQKNSCGDVSQQVDSNLLASFPSFQNALRAGIAAAMMIYVIFFGIRLALGEEKLSLDKLSMFIIKLVLVAYFAIGLGPMQYVNNQLESSNNGTTDVALPILNQAMVDFAQIVFNAGGATGLCAFDTSKYEDGYAYYSLFDAIDCRIAYYLGMQLISSTIDGVSEVPPLSSVTGTERVWDIQSGGPVSLGLTNTEFFGFFFMLFGLLLGGNFVMLIFSLVFLIVFLSITLHFISSFLVCVITLYVMIYISPIFVTFALFNRTKGYFDAWVRILVSCALQPAVLAGFLALVITMLDTGMYDTCEFKRHTYNLAVNNATHYVSTFGLVVPGGENLTSDPCVSSVGYKMMRYYQGEGWDSFGLLIFTIHFINGFTDQIIAIKDLTALALLCIVFYFFSGAMSDFASELTNGPNMKGVTASADKAIDAVVNQAKKAYNAAKAAATSGADKGGGGKGAEDKGGGGNGADDKAEGDSARSGDSARTGGGASDSGGS